MTMNMANRGFKSTSGSVSVAIVVVVLVAAMVAETSAQPFAVVVVNELDNVLTVSQPATSSTTNIPPGSSMPVPVSPQDSTLYLKVLNCVFVVPDSPQGREVSISSTGRLYVTGHCGGGRPGLQFVATIEGAVVNFGCAAPVDSSCQGPFS